MRFLCFVAAGEEMSWGQHFGFIEPSREMAAINAQKEFNVHNVNIAMLLGLAEDHPLYGKLENFSTILGPVFHLLCTMIWLVLPTLRRMGCFVRNALLRSIPVPAVQTMVFLVVNIVVYILVDQLLYDVGERIELAISITVCVASFDLRDQWKAGRVRGYEAGEDGMLAGAGSLSL